MGKLRDQMVMDMRLKGLSPKTISCYVGAMKAIAAHFGKSPAELSDDEIREYLYYLVEARKASRAVISQSYSALKFLFEHTLQKQWNHARIPRTKQHKRLPWVLSREDVEAIFLATKNLKQRAILMTIYSAGLRVGEATRLKVRDIDSKRMMIRVSEGKGLKDRYTLLGERNLELLRTYWKAYRPEDWLFPSVSGSEPVSISCVQKAFSASLRKAGIKKKASVHTLRHCFATHLLESGTDLYYIQRLLGHKSAGTTSVYLHIAGKEIGKIKSPSDHTKDDPKPTP
ncbi:MAG: integrase [Deltaproteobacteria bacterium HGW-Deltaproteobacteria-15]|nr:MAG: integrase [Deltaproteobacteria bacterium HGW-Deltaproteobacteria-15]